MVLEMKMVEMEMETEMETEMVGARNISISFFQVFVVVSICHDFGTDRKRGRALSIESEISTWGYHHTETCAHLTLVTIHS